MNISIKVINHHMPHIVYGVSANTIFYLINFDTMFKDKSFYDNQSHPDIPYDQDDFSRIMNAYIAFGWGEKEIEVAKVKCRELKFGDQILNFLNNFFELKEYFEEEQDDEFKCLLDQIKYGKKEE